MSQSAAKTEQGSRDFRIASGSPWAQAWKVAAALAGVGLLAALWGMSADPRRFAFAYLMGLAAVITIPLGAIFFILTQHLTGAGWGVTVRRTAEFLAAGIVVVPILLLPVLAMGAEHLYPWWSEGDHGVAHAQEAPEAPRHGDAVAEAGGHAADSGHGGAVVHGPEHAAHAAIVAKKHAYLNQPFFFVRAAVYLAVWLFLAFTLLRYSIAQDADGDPQWTVKRERFATWGTFLFAFSLTYAGVDWIMSLEPTWYSTMFGVRVFASSVVVAHALIILIGLGLRKANVVGNEINVEHFHDLGKLMFGFLVFWAYVSFSEFMLIWYAAIPEETIYYHRRWDHETWRILSGSIVGLKFIFPFYLIISRNAKRSYGLIGFGAAWLCAMHLVEMYYWVMPYYADLADVSFSFVGFVTDVGCILFTVGVYFAVVFRRMLRHPVIPIRDPRIARALHFVNA